MERKYNKMEGKKRKREAEKMLQYITWLYLKISVNIHHFAIIKNVVLSHGSDHY